MDTLRIRLFGKLELERGDRALPAFATRTARSLFCFLVVHRDRMFPRSVLLGHLWPEQDEPGARRNLRTTLWRVRRVVEPDGVAAGTYLRIEDDAIGFAPRGAYELDVACFESGVADVERRLGRGDDAGTAAIESVLALYRADLLDDLYDDWCIFERERLRLLFLTTLERLATHHAARADWHGALAAGHALLRRDPLREHVHRLVMRCHMGAGNRPAALLQYQECARLLREELDIGPMPETMRLHDALLRGEKADTGESGDHAVTNGGDRRRAWQGRGLAAAGTVHDLDAAAAHLARARASIARALDQEPLSP